MDNTLCNKEVSFNTRLSYKIYNTQINIFTENVTSNFSKTNSSYHLLQILKHFCNSHRPVSPEVSCNTRFLESKIYWFQTQAQAFVFPIKSTVSSLHMFTGHMHFKWHKSVQRQTCHFITCSPHIQDTLQTNLHKDFQYSP